MTPGSASPLLLDAAAGAYQISRSIRLRSSASAYLTRTPASTGSRTTWTISFWMKRGAFSNAGGFQNLFLSQTLGSSVNYAYFGINLSTQSFTFEDFTSSVSRGMVSTVAVFRDPSAWYHVVLTFDTTNATAANRIRIYVNGVQQTLTITTQIAQNQNGYMNTGSVPHFMCTNNSNPSSNFFDGYLSEINFIDGQALTPSSFGETDLTTGVWKPKRYTGTYGTNGFYLNFSDNSAATAAAIGKDSSGNGNNWTPNNISVTSGATYDSIIDTPTPYADGGNGRGNYAVLNPLSAGSTTTISGGNLNLLLGADGGAYALSTMAVSSGKWYWEVHITTSTYLEIGAYKATAPSGTAAGTYPLEGSDGICWYQLNGSKYGSGFGNVAYGSTYSNGDICAIALDMDAGTITCYKNNVSQGVMLTGMTGLWYPAFGIGNVSATSTISVNFGQRPFAYTPPSGFKALNTQNLPTPTIVKPNAWFDAITYIGNDPGTNTVAQTISGLNFQPDFLWIKNRNNANSHALFDAVRGAGKKIQTDTTAAEQTSGFDTSQTFNANGFTTGKADDTNKGPSGYGFIAWNWKEGATPGFDIVTYTGPASPAAQNVAHSLGVKPEMMIVKARNLASRNWAVYHKELGATQCLRLNLTNAAASVSTYWNNTEPTSTQFTVGTDNDTNANTYNYVAYLFAGVEGFSKFGKYTGNGSADGPFVYCGFRPRWVLLKRTDTAGDNWAVLDTSRDSYNYLQNYLFANSSLSESPTGSGNAFDYLSNGFKVRSTGAGQNGSGSTYIFAAFAENPFKYALAR